MTKAPALAVLKKRAEFLAVAAGGKKWITPGLILQIKTHETPKEINLMTGASRPRRRYGLTATKRIGGAVVRNRARRRLRALANEVIKVNGAPSHDYVLIARAGTATKPFAALRQDLITALKRLKVWQETP